MQTAYITHSACLRHRMFDGHPERPARLHAIQDQLIRARLFDYLRHYDAPQATMAQLARVHAVLYINELLVKSPAEGLVAVDPDTYMNPHSISAARHAAGAAVLATELVMSGEMDNAFCAVRPPGHHAERARAMGFCFFNNVAVGAAHALTAYGLERVAIVDFDVHHGNGTEAIFEDDNRVLVCSVYQHPLFPYSGRASVPNHLINVPLPAGTKSQAFRDAIKAHWLPALETFEPQLIFISAGFDGHCEDEMAQWLLTEADYAWLTRQIIALARRHAKNRVVSSLEGGYALSALGRSVAAHIKELLEV